MRRITDITERPLTVSINEYATLRFAGTKANTRGFHETLFILAFARDLSRAHRAQSQGPRAGRGGGREPLEGRAARGGVPRSQSDDGAARFDRRRGTDPVRDAGDHRISRRDASGRTHSRMSVSAP